MKQRIKIIIISKPIKIIVSPILWFANQYELLLFNSKKNSEINSLVLKVPELKELTVINGPFKGLKYPDFISLGSTLIPKLLGSYEAELHNIIHEIIEFGYVEIWDVGCAEGYYAVGLAMRSPESKIIAFDIDVNSRNACLKMIELNNVKSQVSIQSKCDAKKINDFEFKRGLIISDCEGFEYELFSKVNISEKNLNYLIEIHEWPLEFNMALKIGELFSRTHNLQIIESKSDLFKAKNYSFPPITDSSAHSLEQRFNVFKENRGGNEMIWFYLTKKI